MRTLRALALLCAFVAPTLAAAQSKTLPGEMMTTTVTIEAIEQSTRTLTVVDEKGLHKQIYVPTEVKRFPELSGTVTDLLIGDLFEDKVDRVWPPMESLYPPGKKPPLRWNEGDAPTDAIKANELTLPEGARP